MVDEGGNVAIRVFVVDPFVVIRIIRYVTDYTELGLKYLFETETTTPHKSDTFVIRKYLMMILTLPSK